DREGHRRGCLTVACQVGRRARRESAPPVKRPTEIGFGNSCRRLIDDTPLRNSVILEIDDERTIWAEPILRLIVSPVLGRPASPAKRSTREVPGHPALWTSLYQRCIRGPALRRRDRRPIARIRFPPRPTGWVGTGAGCEQY